MNSWGSMPAMGLPVRLRTLSMPAICHQIKLHLVVTSQASERVGINIGFKTICTP